MGKKKDERKRREREAREAAAQVHDAADRAAGARTDTAAGTEPHDPDRKHGHDRTQDDQKHHDQKHGDWKHGDWKRAHKHGGSAPFAGIAATFVKQLETPLGRQIIAAGLTAAATAIAKHEAKPSARPTPPTPPAPPAPPSASPPPSAATVEPESAAEPAAEMGKSAGTGPFAGETREPPRSDANALPPEFAKVIDSVTVGLERLFAGLGKPGAKKGPPAA